MKICLKYTHQCRMNIKPNETRKQGQHIFEISSTHSNHFSALSITSNYSFAYLLVVMIFSIFLHVRPLLLLLFSLAFVFIRGSIFTFGFPNFPINFPNNIFILIILSTTVTIHKLNDIIRLRVCVFLCM